MGTTVAELTAVITADASQFNSAIDGANQKLQEFGKGAGQAGQQAGKGIERAADGFSAAGKMMAAGGAMMLAPMVDAVRGAASLQQAMDEVTVAFGANEEEAAQLQDTILDVASSTIYGAKDVADAAITMGKAGVSIEDINDGMLQATADFAAATGTQLPIAADIMTRTAAQWGISGKDMIGVADDLTTVFNETSLGAEDWLGGMGNFAPQMRLVGASLEETGATLGFFKDQGLSAREVGTSLTRAMDAMIAPTEGQAEAMAKLGITTEDFFEIGEDGQRQFIGWADTFDMLNAKMADMDDVQKAAILSSIFGKEAYDAMGLGMLSNTDKLRDLTAKMKDNTGIARQQSDMLTDNLLGSIEELGGAYDKLRVKMGDPFLDPLQKGVEGVTGLVNALADADPAVQGFVGKMMSLTGGLLTFGGLAAYGTGQVLDLGQKFAKAGLSLPKFAAGLGLVGLAIGAGLLAYEANLGGFADFVDAKMADAGKAVETFGHTFEESIRHGYNAGLNELANIVQATGHAIKDAFGIDLVEQFDRAAKGIQAFGDAWKGATDAAQRAGLNDVASGIFALGHAIDAALGTDVAPYFERLSRAAQTFGNSWQRAREAGIDPFTSALLGTRDALGSLFDIDLATPLDNFGAALNSGREGLGAFKDDLLAGDWSGAWDGLTGGLADFGLKLDEIDLTGKLQGVSDQVSDWFGNVGDLLFGKKSAYAEDKGAIEGGLIPQLAEDLASGFQQLPGLVGDKLGEIKFSENLGGVKDQFTDWFDGIGDALLGDGQDQKGMVEELATNVAGGFSQLPDLIGQKLGEVNFSENLGGVKDQFTTWIGDIKDLLVGEGSSFAEDRGAIEGGLIPELAGAIATGFEQLPDMINEKMGGNPFDTIGPWLTEQAEALPTTLGSVKDTLLTTGGEIGDDLFNSLLDGIAGKQEHGDMYNPSAMNTREEAVRSGLGSMVQDFMSAAGDFAHDITRTDQDTVRAAENIGRDIGSGMVDLVAGGIRDSFKEPLSSQEKIDTSPMYNPSAMQESDTSWGDAFEGFAGGMWDGMKESLDKEWTESVQPGIAKWSQEKMFDLFNPKSPLGVPNLPFMPGMFGVQGVGAEGLDDKGLDGKNDELGAALGESFGQTLGAAMTSDKFQQKVEQALRDAPVEAFSSVGGAFLKKMTQGMSKAMMAQGDETETKGDPLGQGMGASMIQTITDGLTATLADPDPAMFAPVAGGLLSGISNSIQTAMMDRGPGLASETGKGTSPIGQGMGASLVANLATGLTDSITNADAALFAPMAGALGTQLGAAMSMAEQATQPPGGVGPEGPAVGGLGQEMVSGLATGLANGITTADPALFVPVTSALGAQLGAAMQLAAQPTQAPGGVGPAGPAVPVMGETLVSGLATGLANGITNADPALFVPVSNALGTQLGAAMSMAAQQTQPPGGVGPQGPAVGGIGSDMVTGLAQGLTDSITAAPIETFTPVGTALGTKLGEALQASVEAGSQQGAAGAGGDTSGIGAQLGESVGQMLVSGVEQADFTPVGTALGTKLGETLQTVAEGGGDFNISEQVGTSVGQMLQSGISEADFTGVGDSLTTQLSDQMSTAIEDVSSEISDQMSQITEAISEAVSQMGEAIGEATEQVSQAVEDMSASIEDATSAVSDAVSEMSSAVEEAGSAMEEAASAAADAASEVGDAASEAAESVSSAMQEMASSVQEAAGAIEAAAGQIIAALNSIAAAAGAAGSAIGSALSGGFTSSLGIQSPSKVFMQHGKHIVEGLAIGMGGNNQIVARGSNQLAKQAMGTLGTAIGMGSPAKKFVPHGASITDGMLQGMLQQAKGRMQSAMGQMSGAVESAMGKVKSAVQSGMERVRSQGQQQATSAGAEAASGYAEGMSGEDREAERAARRLWNRAYRELMKGSGAARFLGEAWSREFWEGMLDSSGSMAFAQYVTQQIVGAAENAVAAATGRVKGLATQLEIVAGTISDLQGDIESLEGQLASADQQAASQAQQQRLSALQQELTLQRSITNELEGRLKTEVSAAHQAHIRAVQTGAARAQADYEDKLRRAQATDTAAAESRIRESELATALDAMQRAIAQAAQDELAARRAAIAAELAAKQQQLARETALQGTLEAQQHNAQVAYTQAVITGSNERIQQLKKELRHASGAEQQKTIKAQIALEQQRIATAQQLATALDAQAAASNPESLAQANAQVQFLTAQIEALGQVDVGSLLEGIVSTLGSAASAMSTAATDLGTAATALGEADASAGMNATASAAGNLGQQIQAATGGMFSMGDKYKEVMDKMNAEGYAFQAQFQGMVEKVRGDAATGGENIGTALSTGITGKITEGGPAMQQTMLQGLQGGVDATEEAAGTGATDIATTFGAAMRGQLGVELPQVHQDLVSGMSGAMDATAQEAAQGGQDAMTDYGRSVFDRMKDESPKIQTAVTKPMSDGVRDARQIASQGGRDIGGDLSTGVQQGVQSQAQNIANTAAQTVRDAIQAARNAAQSHSPSRKMMALGDDMGLGLVLGLDGRRGDAEDASARLVHIPLSPTSGAGVTGRRAYEDRHGGDRPIHIENLNLPNVRDPQEFAATLERWASANGVASGRSG